MRRAAAAPPAPPSKPRRRFTEDGFDLDLAYVTPRLIVLAAPQPGLASPAAAGGAATPPRDAPQEVARFLRQRHGGRHRLYDLTGVKEGLSPDAALLGAAVEAFRCDEPTPPLALLASFCEDVDDYLRSDASGVAVLLCRDGVGRSGVLISAYLMHSGAAASADAALAAFAAARSRDGTLALLPSQQRLLGFFDALRMRPLVAPPVPLRLTEVRIRLPANAVPPALRVWQRNAAGTAELLPWSLDARVSRSGADALYAFPPSTPPLAPGDFKFTLAMEARVGGAALGSAWLHTAFVTPGERLPLSSSELDRPASSLASDFLVRLLFAAAPQRAPSRPASPAVGLPPTGRARTPLSFKGAAAATLAARALLSPGAITPPQPSTPRGSVSPAVELPMPPTITPTPAVDSPLAQLAIPAAAPPLSPSGEDTPRRAAIVMQMHRNVEAARREAAAEAETRRELHSKLQRLGAVLGNPQVATSPAAASPPSVVAALAEAAAHIRSLAAALSEERRVNAAQQAQQAKHIRALADALSSERRENAALRARLETAGAQQC